jgi:hypothetical protein
VVEGFREPTELVCRECLSSHQYPIDITIDGRRYLESRQVVAEAVGLYLSHHILMVRIYGN